MMEEKEKKHFVQLRLPLWMAEYLMEQGAKNTRKLPSEIIHRLKRDITRERNVGIAARWESDSNH